MNKIWVFIVLICFVYGAISGNIDNLITASINTPKDTLDLVIKVGGLIIFYNGIFQIAIDSSVIKKLANLIHPIVRIIFKDLKKDSIVHELVSANIIANFLGLGIASTPIAIKALKALKEELKDQTKPSISMVKLILINVAAFTIFPLSILSVRKIYNAKINLELVPFFILVSFILTIIAIIFTNIWGKDYE